MARRPLWTPSLKHAQEANLTHFIEFVNREYSVDVRKYSELHQWSVGKPSDFWAAVWRYTGIISSKPYERAVDDLSKFPGAKWFPGARMNFAENLLRHYDDRPALISRYETEDRSSLTFADLRREVGRVAAWLRENDVRPGDRVAGYLPNIPAAAIAMLATTSVGAVWACCGAELGPNAVLDRLGQVKPKVLFAADGYFYKGKRFDITPNVEKIVDGVASIQKLAIASNFGDGSSPGTIHDSADFDDLGSRKNSRLVFEQLPADHPVYIMFTSGTTGKPKCMVQGAAGVLINQLKEIMFHADLKKTDRATYIASPSWMMWNWLMSCLAVGSTIVLYDGNPTHPDWGRMWNLVQQEKLSFLGCSASYINFLRNISAEPGQRFDLSLLREISQTGSPLSSEGFEWVYEHIKPDLFFNSISGGTDINGCFAGGVPIQPVYAGELQAPGLGMKINVYDENARPVVDELGELVCEAPAPSMPLYFWDDPEDRRYRKAYFEYYGSKGKNVWRHGDFVMLHSDTGGITFYGRSDAVMKVSGIRIGTAEIYNVLDKVEEIVDSLAVAQGWRDDQRILLFVKLARDNHLTAGLEDKIRRLLRDEASPKHVPAVIIAVPDIPYTFNMKKVETAVANIVNGRPVSNLDALSNPESLDFYRRIVPSLQGTPEHVRETRTAAQ